MTNEEAIKYFKRHLDLYCVDGISREAEEMAIQALSQEPITATNNNEPMTIIYPTIVCDDAISRDMALEKMADYVASGYADSAEDFEEYSRIICQLPSVTQKSGKWIPVSERLPEEGQWVMVTFDGKIAVCIAHDNDGTLREATSLVLKNATEIWLYPESEWGDGYAAWMPLPEPYKAESEE